MKIHQLRYFCEVARQGFNVSAAAAALHTSQSGVSKQIRQLEDELGFEIFVRKGKRVLDLTQQGHAMFGMAARILRDMEDLKRIGRDFSNEVEGTFVIATTHTQARYVLPGAVRQFTRQYPKVRLHLHQGSPTRIAEMVRSGTADIAIATEALSSVKDLLALPCYEWNRCIVAPIGHAVLSEDPLTLDALARHPIITYDPAFAGRSLIDKAFAEAGLAPNVVLSAIDADVIKTYVELGLGVGILARMAFEPERDRGLGCRDASHLFESSTTYLAVRRGGYVRKYVYTFIELFAPHLDRHTVDAAMRA